MKGNGWLADWLVGWPLPPLEVVDVVTQFNSNRIESNRMISLLHHHHQLPGGQLCNLSCLWGSLSSSSSSRQRRCPPHQPDDRPSIAAGATFMVLIFVSVVLVFMIMPHIWTRAWYDRLDACMDGWMDGGTGVGLFGSIRKTHCFIPITNVRFQFFYYLSSVRCCRLTYLRLSCLHPYLEMMWSAPYKHRRRWEGNCITMKRVRMRTICFILFTSWDVLSVFISMYKYILQIWYTLNMWYPFLQHINRTVNRVIHIKVSYGNIFWK